MPYQLNEIIPFEVVFRHTADGQPFLPTDAKITVIAPDGTVTTAAAARVGTTFIYGRSVTANQAGNWVWFPVTTDEDITPTTYTAVEVGQAWIQYLDSLLSTIKADTTSILARLGAFTGTGVNTVLGFLRAMSRSDLTAPSDMGGTFDPATDSEQAIAAAIASFVTGNAAAVWNYLVSSLGATTTVGGWFNSLLVAIKAKTDTIGAATITVVSGVVSTQSLVFVLGNDYLVADGRQWDFIYSGYPSFLGGSAVLNLTPLGNVDNLLFTLTGEIYNATTIRFEPTHIETGSATLVASVGTERSMQFLLEIKVTLSDGSVITPTPLGLGRATVYSYA